MRRLSTAPTPSSFWAAPFLVRARLDETLELIGDAKASDVDADQRRALSLLKAEDNADPGATGPSARSACRRDRGQSVEHRRCAYRRAHQSRRTRRMPKRAKIKVGTGFWKSIPNQPHAWMLDVQIKNRRGPLQPRPLTSLGQADRRAGSRPMIASRSCAPRS